MLATTPGVGELPPVVAYEHHLRIDSELAERGWRPNIVSQLVTLADVYDALRTSRPYRDAMPPDTALETMEKDVGTRFDPHLFDGFSRILGYYPPGTCVRFDDDSIGVVHSSNTQDPRKPRAFVVRDAAGDVVVPAEPIDLIDRSNGEHESIAGIVEVVAPEAHDIDPMNFL